MLRRNSTLFIVFIIILLFAYLFSAEQNVYKEYNYSEVEVVFDRLSINASMHGSYNEVEGVVTKKDPYYLKVEISDFGHSYHSIKLESVELSATNSGKTLNNIELSSDVDFSDSQLKEGTYAALIVEDLNLLKEDYEFQSKLALCKKNGVCEKRVIKGVFKLNVTSYKRNTLIETLLSV